MQNQQQQPKKSPRTARRIFGLGAIAFYVLAVIAAAPPPHTSVAFAVFTIIAFLSFFLWVATYVDERRAKQPRPLVPAGRKVTTEDIYMETALIEQEARQVAGQAALREIARTPDEVGGLMVLGVVIDEEPYLRPSPLHQRVIRRERWTRVAIAILGGFMGGGSR
jgi:hypothetical protein